MLQKRYVQLLLTVFFSVCIIASCVWAYGDHFAMGATGDDSPGYIYLAALMARGEPLLWQDALGKQALDFFGDYRYASWILPTHHEFIHPNGMIASKYPLGASLLLAGFAFIGSTVTSGSVLGMYFMQPVFGGAIVLFTYIFAVVLFPRYPIGRHVVGVTAAGTLALSDVFYDTVISYPMREIPSMVLLLLSALFFVSTMRAYTAKENLTLKRNTIAGFFGFGVLFGLACTVRETSVVILPAFVVYAVLLTWKGQVSAQTISAYIRQIWQAIGLILIGFLIGVAPIVWNAVQISTYNEPFKARDTGEVVLLSNINHLQTVSLTNVFESTGRYRPADGSLEQYWKVLNHVSALPFIPLFAIAGCGLLLFSRNREDQGVAVLLGGWALGTLTMFSLWINPYSRYILPLIPVVLLLAASGWLVFLRQFIASTFGDRFALVIAALLVLSVAGSSVEPLRLMKIDHAVDEYPSRALTRQDAQFLDDIGTVVTVETSAQQGTVEKTIVFFTSPTRFGLSEVFMAHTGVRGARLPYEEEKEQPDPEMVDAFLEQLITNGYVLYVVMPVSSSPELVEFEKRWNDRGSLESVQIDGREDIDFSFAQDSTLKQLQLK